MALEIEVDRYGPQLQRHNPLDQFTTQFAHDLRAPFTRILQVLELLQRDHAGLGDDGRACIEVIERSAQHGLGLVRDLLALARAGVARSEPVRLDRLAAEAAQSVDGLTLDVRSAVEIVADPILLRQALANLFVNAARYAKVGDAARITVRCADKAVEWRISVADRGRGVAGVDAGTVFRPFVRGSLDSSGDEGTGLGLAIVAATAIAHGGRAWYQPRRGGGSVFWLSIAKPVATLRAVPPLVG